MRLSCAGVFDKKPANNRKVIAMREKTTDVIRKWIQIALASFLYAAGISLFLDPNNLAAGGVTGISIILNRLIHVETGTLYLLLNIPILILGMWKLGARFIARTAYAVALTSLFTNFLSKISPVTDDLLFAAAAGGMLVAVGMAFIFKAGATTGGTDILVKIIRVRHRYLKTGVIFMCSDVVIVTLSGLIFGNLNLAFYALFSVVVTSWVMDFVLYGGDEAKLFYIITDRPEEIGRRLLEELDVGVTYLQGKGGWTGEEKKVIFCVVQKRTGAKVEEIVKNVDPSAFTIVTSANEIYGEGYKDFFGEIV